MNIIKTPCRESYFMRLAYEAAQQSKDPRTKIGAVLVMDDQPISIGFNGFPRKVKDLAARYEDRETKYDFISHAECSTIANAARMGRATLNSCLYCFGMPCANCAKMIIQSGVNAVVIHEHWPAMALYSELWKNSCEISSIMFQESGVIVKTLSNKLGVKAFRDGKEIDV